LFQEILKAVELNTAITYIPQLWSDIVVFDQANRENNLSLILSIMANYYPTDAEDLDLIQQENLCKQFTEISWKIWRLVEDQDPERRKQVTWSGHMLGDLIKLQVRGGEFEKASDIIRKLLTPEAASDVIGVPPLDSLELFLKSAMTEKNGSMCLVSVICSSITGESP
jgi:pentatricopeptide repeat domain-containing protein 3